MSYVPGADADMDMDCPEEVDMVIIPRTGDIGNFEVRRALPFREKRMVGPFIFWDQMGPGEFLTGQGVDVRPHPHIGLSTVTYLFDGTMDHKDSLGHEMRIVPGDVNLMTAGKGIVHSERTGDDVRENPSRLFGIQSWVASPKAHEAGDADFKHVKSQDLPVFDDKGVKGRVILGAFQGLHSPVQSQWETQYVEMFISAGQSVEIPKETEERALYGVKGRIEIAGQDYDSQQMMVLCPGQDVTVRALDDVHLILLGGATMDGPRYIWWNFVSSDVEQIREAAKRWSDGSFAKVAGDPEFIPLPDMPFPKEK